MWKTVKLGDVCDVLDKLRKPITKKYRVSGDIPYYGATGVVDWVADFIFNEKLVLVGEDGAKWGVGDATAFIVHGKTWVNNHAHVLRPHDGTLLHEWLAYYLTAIDLSPWVTGLTVPKLNQAQLRSIPIPIPPLAEQQRIVAKLDAAFAEIDRAIDTTTRSLTESIRLLHSSLELCIAKGGGETESITLGDETFLEIIDGDRGAKYPKKSDFSAEGYCVFLNTKNVLQNGFNFDTCQFISDERDALLRKGKLQRHDVVLTTRGTLGNVGYYSECVPYENIRINSGMLILRAKTHKLLPSFLFELLRSNSIKLQIEKQQKGAAQQHIPVKTLSKFAVEIPTSVEAQSRVVQEIKNVQSEAYELKEVYAKKLTQLGALKSAILAQELQPPQSEAA